MCSLSTGTGGQSADWRSTMSCHQMSRPATIGARRRRVRSTTSDALDRGRVCERLVGRGLEADRLAPPPAAVGGDQDLRLGVVDPTASASAEKPPKTTVWGAPSRAQASIAIGSSGIIGM